MYNLARKETYFTLSFVLCILIKLLFLDKSLTFDSQLWAEAGTNYFLAPHQHGFWKSFLVLDFGYIPLWPRLVANIIYFLNIKPYLIPYFYQIFTILFISLCTAFINLTRNRVLISSDRLRFFLSLLFCFHLDYELHTFINFSYWALIPCIFILSWFYFSDSIQNLSKSEQFFSVSFVILALLSKAMMVALLPVIFLLFIRNKQFLLSKILLLSTAAIQLTVTALNAPKETAFSVSFDPIIFLKNQIYYTLIFPLFSLAKAGSLNSKHLILYIILSTLVITFILFHLAKFYKFNHLKLFQFRYIANLKYLLFILFLFFSFFFSLAITLKGYPSLFYINLSSESPLASQFLNTRLLFFQVVIFYIILFSLFEPIKKSLTFYKFKAHYQKYYFTFAFVLIIIINNPVFDLSFSPHHSSFPNINNKLFSELIHPEKEQCLPINPFPWMINFSNCFLLASSQASINFDLKSLSASSPIEISLPLETNNQNIKILHLFFTHIIATTPSISITDENNNIFNLKPQVSSSYTLRWILEKPTKIKKIALNGVQQISSVNNQPYFQFFGVTNEK